MSWDDINTKNYEWSKLKTEQEMENYIKSVKEYRLKVKDLILSLIE